MKKKSFTVEEHQAAARVLGTAQQILGSLSIAVHAVYGVSSPQGRAADKLFGTGGSSHIQKLRSALEDSWHTEGHTDAAPYYGSDSEYHRDTEAGFLARKQ